MRLRLLTPLAIAAVVAGAAMAATSAQDVVLSNEQVVVRRLVLEPGAATPLHTHDHDHIAVALGGGEIADVAPDGTERRLTLADGALRFVPSGVTHTLRNLGGAPFRAVTIDLLAPQTGARNRCGAVVAGQPTDCPDKAAAASAKRKGGAMVPQMETDQTLVTLLTLAPGARHEFKPVPTPPLMVALTGTSATGVVELTLAGGAVGRGERPLEGGDALCPPPRTGVTLINTGAAPARFIVIEFKPRAGLPDAARAKFVDMARHAMCADRRNRLFIIDRSFVFWDRAGSCPDNSYGMALYGDSPEAPLCSSGDSIAGPVSDCDGETHRKLFETISGHRDAPDLGLGPGHTVDELPL